MFFFQRTPPQKEGFVAVGTTTKKHKEEKRGVRIYCFVFRRQLRFQTQNLFADFGFLGARSAQKNCSLGKVSPRSDDWMPEEGERTDDFGMHRF